jgi:RHS repeat-associated protein
MTRSMPVLLLIALLIAFAQAAFSQTAATPEVGDNPYKSYSGGDIDHIQMQNGNLYLRIPLLSYPQLGKLDLSFSILANSTQIEELASCDESGDCTYWYAFNTPEGGCQVGGDVNGPYNSVSNLDGRSNAWIVVDQDVQVQSCYQQPVEGYYWILGALMTSYNYYTIYGLVDSSDAVHLLGYNQNNWSAMQTTDGSGYTVQMPWANTESAAGPADALPDCGTTVAIYDSSGVKQASSSTCNSQGFPATSTTTISDPAGNTIQRSATNNQQTNNRITDSVGRQIPDPTVIPNIYPSETGLPSGIALDANPAAVCPDLGVTAEPVAYSVSWTVPGYQGASSTYHFCYSNVTIGTDFFGAGVGATSTGLSGNCTTDEYGNTYCPWYAMVDMSETYPALQSVVLPNGTHWGFVYNTATSSSQVSFGDLTQVILPSGGSINYAYSTIPVCGIVSGFEMPPEGRAVAMRTLTPLVGEPVTSYFNYFQATSSRPTPLTIETDAYGNDTVHTFTPGGGPCDFSETATKWYQGSSNGGASGTVLKEVDTAYTYELNPQDDYTDDDRAHINVLPQTRTTYLNGQVQSTVSYAYDTLFTASQTYESGIFPTQSPIRYMIPAFTNDGIRQTDTVREAAVNSSYQAAGLLALPQSVTEYDENSNLLATTTYAYDEPACSPSGVLGNLTSITRDYGTKTSWCYNTKAMKTSTTDPNGNGGIGNGTTSYSYDSTGLYIKQVQAPTTNGVQHVRNYQQDSDTGWLNQASDENNNITSYNYDQVGRLTQVNYPDGGEITQCFTDEGGATCSLSGPPYSVVTLKLQSASIWQRSSATYDGLGRPLFAEAPTASYTADAYDVAGNLCVQSNPSFTAPPSSGFSCTPGQNPAPVSSTDGYTYFAYDPIHRKLSMTNPDSSNESWTYNGNTVLFHDEDSNQWQRTYDQRNRLTKVVEPGSLSTTYSYDSLDDLTCADQWGTNSPGAACNSSRPRIFAYDHLSRLLTALNPETGKVCYGVWSGSSCINGYDPDGNLLAKTDARGIIVGFSYDGLNRLCYKVSGGAAPSQNPNGCPTTTPSNALAAYQYDTAWISGASNTIGELTYSTNTVNAAEAYSYDLMGRPKQQWYWTPQNANWNSNVSALYDFAGDLTQMTYPDSRVVTRGFPDSTGQLRSVADPWIVTSTNTGGTYLSSLGFDAPGDVTSGSIGGSLADLTASYNNRLWVASLDYTMGSSNKWWKQYFWQLNGNLDHANDMVAATTRQYGYDALNRVTSALDKVTSSGNTAPGGLNESFSYNGDSGELGGAFANLWESGNFTFLPTSYNAANQPTGSWTFDAAGNLTKDANANTYTWDAESKQTAYNSTSYYYYADDNRAGKSGSTPTDYVNFNGQSVARYSGGAWTDLVYGMSGPSAEVTGASGVPDYRFTDNLGSSVGFTSTSGSLSIQDYAPFGQCFNGCTDPDPYKFTGKERDTESGNDYFGARYMASSMGRFLSPDPTAFSTFLGDPQSWNRYMYASNNPLSKVDRNGLWPTKTHEDIINRAFPGLTDQQRQRLKDVSAHQDSLWSGGQGESKSYQHEMRSDSETVQQAQSEYNKFVSDSEAAAAQDQVNFWKQMTPDVEPSGINGLSSDALSEFGLALHAVTDSTSPAHIGFQEWKWDDPMGVLDHIQTEATHTPQQMQSAVNAAQQAFRRTFGDYWYLMATGCHSWVTTDKVGGGTESTCAD